MAMTKREFLKTCALGLGGSLIDPECRRALAACVPSRPMADGPDKWSKEALYYIETADGLKCTKCPHGCLLGKGEAGICRNRVNFDGKLYTIAYGNPCAVHVDPIEKKPFFHFLPSTQAFSIAAAGCNLRCLNCQNWQISQFSPRETINEDLMPDRVVAECLAGKCESIAYTYSEPNTFYEYACDTAVLARKKGIRNLWKSSGYINEEPLRRLCKVVDAANIDLKGFDESVYQKLNGASLAPVLRTLQVMKEEGVWLEITNLVVPTWTDDVATIEKMCRWLSQNGFADTPLHFSRFTPLYKLNQLPSTPVTILDEARKIAMACGLNYVYIGNVPGHEAENTSCHSCGKLVVERRGFSILRMEIAEGKCRYCNSVVPGVWGR